MPAELVFTSSEADLVSGSGRTLRVEVRDDASNLVMTDSGRAVMHLLEGTSSSFVRAFPDK
jgi:hypothetical protein